MYYVNANKHALIRDNDLKFFGPTSSIFEKENRQDRPTAAQIYTKLRK
jgi:hypothetical protein